MRLTYKGCSRCKDKSDYDLMIYHFIPVKDGMLRTTIDIKWFNIGSENIEELLVKDSVEWRRRVDVHLPDKTCNENHMIYDKVYFNGIEDVCDVLRYGFGKYKKELLDLKEIHENH